jgi:hypothetical protein
MQKKMAIVTETLAQLRLRINKTKTKISTTNTIPYFSLNIGGEKIEKVNHLTWLNSKEEHKQM